MMEKLEVQFDRKYLPFTVLNDIFHYFCGDFFYTQGYWGLNVNHETGCARADHVYSTEH